jgi:hypothetical protein
MKCWTVRHISRDVPIILLFVVKQMLRRFPNSKVATACVSCSLPDLNSSELNHFLCRTLNYLAGSESECSNSVSVVYSNNLLLIIIIKKLSL